MRQLPLKITGNAGPVNIPSQIDKAIVDGIINSGDS